MSTKELFGCVTQKQWNKGLGGPHTIIGNH